MLDAISTGINTVVFTTPILGSAIFFLVNTTRAGNIGWISRGIGGGIAGATVAAMWEYTVNNSHRPEIKAEVILGSAGVGAGAAVFSGNMDRRF